jgi:hypothetical protein
MKAFLNDRLNRAWLVSVVVLGLLLLFVSNNGVGTFVLIASAVVTIGLTGTIRIRDAKRDRARRGSRKGYPHN